MQVNSARISKPPRGGDIVSLKHATFALRLKLLNFGIVSAFHTDYCFQLLSTDHGIKDFGTRQRFGIFLVSAFLRSPARHFDKRAGPASLVYSGAGLNKRIGHGSRSCQIFPAYHSGRQSFAHILDLFSNSSLANFMGFQVLPYSSSVSRPD